MMARQQEVLDRWRPATALRAQGRELDPSSDALGELRRSDDAVGDPVELRRRLAEDGYLFLPGYLDRGEVLGARADLLARLAKEGALAPGTDPEEGVPNPESRGGLYAETARRSEPLQQLLYGDRMITLYESIFAESVRHYDFTWLRAVAPGIGTAPHGDSVFMNRGTLNLLTAWVPLGDIDRTLGGVAVLENSHLLEDVKRGYGSRDVDAYCSDDEEAGSLGQRDRMLWNGWLSDDPPALRKQLGGRWLTTDYRAGDLLTFTMFTLHLGLDNSTDRIRLSSDSRYQPASEPADPRWIGADPPAHGRRAKRAMIC